MSRSGYYCWLYRDLHRDKESLELLRSVHEHFRGKAGIRTIKMYLEQKYGIIMNLKKIYRLKKSCGLVTTIRSRSKFTSCTINKHRENQSPNLVNMVFKRLHTDEVYSTDITYLPYRNGQAYLSVFKDLGSREIVHYRVGANMSLPLVCDGLDELLDRRPNRQLIIHSDQGGHYLSPTYRQKLKDYGVTQSMSRRGNCLDNAPVESFFGHMKDEIDTKSCTSFAEIKMMVSNYIEYYNSERPQWTLKKMTPAQYRRHINS